MFRFFHIDHKLIKKKKKQKYYLYDLKRSISEDCM